METIFKKQTLEQVLSDFKRLRDSGCNPEGFIPSFFEDTMKVCLDNIEELTRISSSETNNSVFINLFILKKEGVKTLDDFRKFILRYKPETPNEIEPYKDFEDRLKYIYEDLKISIGGRCTEIFYFNNVNGTYPSTKLIICNAYRNPFDTMQTIFHEFCHAIQFKYDERKYSNLWREIGKKDKYSELEYNEILRDYYINHLFIVETEADLFGCMLPLVKALSIGKKELVDTTIKQIENFLFQQKPYDVFGGYFSYPILKDFLYNEEKLKELKKFIGEDGKIDCLVLRNFTKELTLKKQQEYYEDLFKDDTIDYTLLDRNNAREEDRKKFIEEHRNSKFVKDHLEFVEKCREYRPDIVSILQNCLLDLRREKPRNEEYSKKILETALKKSELMEELKFFSETNKRLKETTVEVSV